MVSRGTSTPSLPETPLPRELLPALQLTGQSLGSLAKCTGDGHRKDGCPDFSEMPVQLGRLACKTPHLKAGQDEVHSFLRGEDFEEAIAGQQNEPTTWELRLTQLLSAAHPETDKENHPVV